ncbi:hypothetical protein ACE1ET_20315 [Saccharicrinis sp. FJH62]|uniref:5'-methylthioadenosine/S-adenosylhomocysteine nucleosidase family protein n=1 Tax=Saccharicrinis sp. FJH62 TaxID=3344657 RepID=UPI0035D484D3
MNIIETIGGIFFKDYSVDTYPILVASALHEEMTPLLAGKKWSYISDDQNIRQYKVTNSKKRSYNVISYSLNRMGMPMNGVGITKTIEILKPKYVIFIGTCAGLNKKTDTNTNGENEGDVLIPDYIYAYDSGKHNDKGVFKVEHRHYDVSQNLRSIVSDMLQTIRKPRFKVELDCGFCSGASVVSYKKMRDNIIKSANRKVAGFDMEAYVLACINQLYPNIETIVLKGIMDFGEHKDDKFKRKAKVNSAKIADELINYIVENDSKLL